ncbi:hypothetical protein ACVJF0_005822 [Bradyrhizobium elkanii]
MVSAASAEAPRFFADHDAGGDRQHVLGRAADLDAAHVGGVIGPEGRRAERLDQRACERFVPGGQRNRGRQSARDVVGKARPRQDRGHGARRGFRDHLGHEFVRAVLDALGAGDDRRVGFEMRRKMPDRRAQMLRRRHG